MDDQEYSPVCERETAKARISHAIAGLRHKIACLEALLKVAEHAEDGSPLEEALWEMSCIY